MMPEPLEWDAERAAEVIAEGAGLEGGLLPLLHSLQTTFGCVPDEAVPMLAHALNLSRAEVHGVLSFYHDFRRTRPVGPVIRLCRAEACQARGARSVEAALSRALATEVDKPAGPLGVALESVYCLGLCAVGPAAMVDGALVARLDGDRLTKLIASVGP